MSAKIGRPEKKRRRLVYFIVNAVQFCIAKCVFELREPFDSDKLNYYSEQMFCFNFIV